MDYKARFYDPALMRFTQPDSIVPGAGNPQAWNRYAYTLNNPVNLIDPDGHAPICDEEGNCYDPARGQYRGTRSDSPPSRVVNNAEYYYTTSDSCITDAVGGGLYGPPSGIQEEETDYPPQNYIISDSYVPPAPEVVVQSAVGLAINIASYLTYYVAPSYFHDWYAYGIYKPDPILNPFIPPPGIQPQSSDLWWILSSVGIENKTEHTIGVLTIATRIVPRGTNLTEGVYHSVYPPSGTYIQSTDYGLAASQSEAVVSLHRSLSTIIPPDSSMFVSIGVFSELKQYGAAIIQITP